MPGMAVGRRDPEEGAVSSVLCSFQVRPGRPAVSPCHRLPADRLAGTGLGTHGPESYTPSLLCVFAQNHMHIRDRGQCAVTSGSQFLSTTSWETVDRFLTMGAFPKPCSAEH